MYSTHTLTYYFNHHDLQQIVNDLRHGPAKSNQGKVQPERPVPPWPWPTFAVTARDLTQRTADRSSRRREHSGCDINGYDYPLVN